MRFYVCEFYFRINFQALIFIETILSYFNMVKKELNVLGNKLELLFKKEENFINLIDIAKYKNPEISRNIVMNWMRSRSTIEFLGIWEKIHNPKFNVFEFEYIKNESGSNAFFLSPSKWIEKTNSIGIISKLGKFGGVYAQEDIAIEFASWISAEFKLYLINEFRRLKEEEKLKQTSDWNVKRTLTKINYEIHTQVIKENLIPKEISQDQINKIYADEADILNIALFTITAKEWKEKNPNLKGNLRDHCSISQMICLSNLESLNSVMIQEGIEQSKRLVKLNQIARYQMKVLTKNILVNDLSNIENNQFEKLK